jgi:hypothetical protein
MDHRNPPLADPMPGPESPGPPTAGTTAPAPRRPALTRLGLAAALAVAATGLLGLGGARAVRCLVDWLHRRPEYQLPFRQIVLDPPPPPWIRSGRTGLLVRVGAQARWPESLPVQDLDLRDLARDFRNHCPWVARLRHPRGIERSYPNHLVVHLDYREPVAEVRFGSSSFVLDADAVILPADDLDRDVTGPLIQLDGLDPPSDGRPGRYWETSADAPARPDPRAAAAARLAAFLKARARLEGPGGSPLSHPVAINYDEDLGLLWLRSKLWVRGKDRIWVYWGEAPDAEAPGRPTAAEKWTLLRDWVRRHDPSGVANPESDYLDFARGGVVVRRGKPRTR